jgi:hypothetical protein
MLNLGQFEEQFINRVIYLWHSESELTHYKSQFQLIWFATMHAFTALILPESLDCFRTLVLWIPHFHFEMLEDLVFTHIRAVMAQCTRHKRSCTIRLIINFSSVPKSDLCHKYFNIVICFRVSWALHCTNHTRTFGNNSGHQLLHISCVIVYTVIRLMSCWSARESWASW